MSQRVAEHAPSFEERAAGKIRVSTWEQPPDHFDWIEPTGFTSPRLEPKAPPANGQRCGKMKFYNESKSYGFTKCGIYVHCRNVVSGQLRTGARICFDVKEGGKSPEAVNVRVIG
ncbi:cold-shock protein [Brevibacillus borstelensis]|uniref:cold-shock protein n=1 Tax=Brevibacillus borstelensis TaxID=45462 RepID=UPI000469F136|nr:cold shock domain-containing protein [Brevibacillus borstelensis]MCC0566549.1 cold shock domain-containing protein [Brevibacillus borstelensis]MCM3473055.1 cold shock domain-containing protein [Brevibacillus borstelensis]MCM3561681.1 cold shock domain-containing protein [Brevibacillus borstelensis]MED1852983.1 cold shock domain-containing protein [Brevibacillus borstelensis]